MGLKLPSKTGDKEGGEEELDGLLRFGKTKEVVGLKGGQEKELSISSSPYWRRANSVRPRTKREKRSRRWGGKG